MPLVIFFLGLYFMVVYWKVSKVRLNLKVCYY